MARTRHLWLVLFALLAVAAPAMAGGSANPSLKWSISYAPYLETPAQKAAAGQQMVSHFDLMELEPGNLDFPGYMVPLNPNFKFFRYDNISNNNRGGHRNKWMDLQNFCVGNGWDFEKMWCHFSDDTHVGIGPDQSYEDQLMMVETYISGVFRDESYWAYGSDPGTDKKFCAAAGDMVYIGHFDRFSAVVFGLKVAASANWAGTVEYLRADSTWQPLSVNDSTADLTQNGSMHFTPPASWGFLTVDGNRAYWVRVRCTATPTTAPEWSYLRKEKYIYKDAQGYYVVPGWDPANDKNHDGWVDDTEYASLVNSNAHARFRYQARIPSYSLNPPRFVANVGDSLYQQLNANYEVSTCQNTSVYGGYPVTGIFEDNDIPTDGSITVSAGNFNLADSLFCGNYTYVAGGHVVEFPGPGPGRLFHMAYLTADSIAYSRLNAAGFQLEGNPSQFYCDNHLAQYDPQSVHTIVRGDSGGYWAYSIHNGCQREFFLSPKQSIDNDNSPVVTASVQFKMAKELTAHGHWAEFLFRASYADADYGSGTMTVGRDKMYAQAYFLMFSNPNAYGSWMPSGSSSPPESTQWWPSLGYDIGVPQNDSVYVFQAGTDSNGEPYHVYARYFTKALVLVKPKPYWNSQFTETTSPVTPVNLPTTMQRLNWDGTLGSQISQVALKNVEGAVLLGTVTAPGGAPPPPPPPDTTPPGQTSTLDARFVAAQVAPADQGLGSTRSSIKVDLSEDVDPSTATSSVLVVTGSVSGAHAGTLNVVKRYLTFTPTTPFSAGERITVRLVGTLKSTSGRFLDGDANGTPGGDKVWTFTVGSY